MAGRSGWAYGAVAGGEWLTIHGSAYQRPVLYPARELAAEALEASSLRDSGLSVAHVTEIWHAGMTGPRPCAYRITPGTCPPPAGPGRGRPSGPAPAGAIMQPGED
jgi:hypothetical protein